VTTFHFSGTVAWNRMGPFITTGRGVRTQSFLDPNTGLTPAGATQNSVAVTQITADATTGQWAFTTTDVAACLLDFGAGPQMVLANELPNLVITAAATTDSAVASAVGNSASATRAQLDQRYAAVVPLYPTMTLSAIQARINAAPAGSRLWFAPGTYPTGTIVVPADGMFVDAPGATFQVSVWGAPSFDAIGRNDCLFDIGLAQFTGTRGDHTGTTRGQATYTIGAGVYINGDRNRIRRLRTIDLPTPVNFSSWDGSSISGHTGTGNSVGRLEVSGYDFGVLWLAQKDLVLEDLYGHNDHDDSSGANPTHLYYGSGISTARSTGVAIKKARCENHTGGQPFQLKYADQTKLTHHVADTTTGLVNILDCDDLEWDGMLGVNLSAAGTGAVTFGFTTAVPKRPVLSNTTVRQAANNDERAVSIWGDDARIRGMHVEANHSGSVNTALNDVVLRGSRSEADDVSIRSIGAGHMRGIATGIGTDTVSDWRIHGPKMDGPRSVVDILASSTGVRIYGDPNASTLTGGGAAFTVSGTATGSEYSVTTPRHAYLTTYGTAPGTAAVLSGSSVIVPVANNGIQVLITPDCDIAVSNLLWFSVTQSGNYDIAIVDDALSTRLWSKGSTAWPAAGTITETVTSVTMRAGRTYRIVFSADNITGALRGTAAAAGDMLIRMDGLFAAYLQTSMFPVPSTPARGSGASTRLPYIILKGA
jgi:hypothetical protein